MIMVRLEAEEEHSECLYALKRPLRNHCAIRLCNTSMQYVCNTSVQYIAMHLCNTPLQYVCAIKARQDNAAKDSFLLLDSDAVETIAS
jgi:hypothetical protein